MPRKARQQSDSGVYHIILRGINRQNIFEDEEDNNKFLIILDRYKDSSGYELYAYCLMGNHIHLLLRAGGEPIAQVMRRICGKFVFWYNKKYERIGNLFQDRFKSEPVEDDAYLLTVIRYIHQNPIKVGLAKNISNYRWSSYSVYLKKDQRFASLVDTEFPLKIFDQNEEKAVRAFVDFHSQMKEDKCLDVGDDFRKTDREAREIIAKLCNVGSPLELQKMEQTRRNACLVKLREESYLSIRQIERLTGVSRGIIQRV